MAQAVWNCFIFIKTEFRSHDYQKVSPIAYCITFYHMNSHRKGWARHPHRDVPLSQRGPKGLCSTVRTRAVGCRCRQFAPWLFPACSLVDRPQDQWFGCRADNSLQWAMELNRDFHKNGYFCCNEDKFGYLEVKHRLQNKIVFTQGLKIAISDHLWG